MKVEVKLDTQWGYNEHRRYAYEVAEPVKVGDRVDTDSGQGTVTDLGSDYDGPLKRAWKVAKARR